MKKANVAELKNRLSHYLRFVRAGQSVLVYDRNQPIARIDPVREADAADPESWIAELEARGTVRPPSARLPGTWLRARPTARANVIEALLEERESSR